jgi:hypothetical protein
MEMPSCPSENNMIEFLKLIIDVAIKAVSSLSTRRDNQRMGDVGSELFLFYVQVNEAMMAGYDIIGSLEVYVERMGRHLATGGDRYALTGGDWIRYKVQVQVINLARIGETMQRWGYPLQIIDGEAFSKIVPLIDGKRNALDVLLNILRADSIPVSMTWPQYLAVAMQGQELATEASLGEITESAGALQSRAAEEAIPLDNFGTREVYENIKSYLEMRNPRAQLDEIRKGLESIREAIERNFTLKDILLRTGDERFSLRYHGKYFW